MSRRRHRPRRGQARAARREQQETTFFGSLDGASKFVKGDAVAGLLITLLNLVVGLVIGIADARHADRPGVRDLRDPDGGRRPGGPDPRGHHLDRLGAAAGAGRGDRIDRPRGVLAAGQAPRGARHGGRADGALRAGARPAVPALHRRAPARWAPRPGSCIATRTVARPRRRVPTKPPRRPRARSRWATCSTSTTSTSQFAPDLVPDGARPGDRARRADRRTCAPMSPRPTG